MKDAGAIRVLHVVRTLAVGGVEVGLVNLALGLRGMGFTQSICCLRGAGELSKELPDSLPYTVCGEETDGERYRYLLRAARCFRAFRPDIVHVRNCGAWVDASAAWFLAACPGRLLVSIHGLDWAGTIPARRARVYRILSRFTSSLVTVSRQTAEQFAHQSGIAPTRFRTVHSGIDTCIFRVREALSDQPALPSVVIGCVGRLGTLKGHDTLIRAFLEASRRSQVQMELRLFGEGPQRSALEDMVRHEGAQESIRFYGCRRDIPEQLRELDIFVLASRTEGRPTSIMEAMASGLPVVATRVGAVPDLVADGETGLLVEPGDWRSLAGAMIRLAEDSALRFRLGVRAREIAVCSLALDQMIARYATLYRELIMAALPRS